MSLRTRLILAFFLLSVVPMAAVTIYTYVSNVEALRVAAEHEADLLAGELGQRMSLVTAQLSERVEHLMDMRSCRPPSTPHRSRPPRRRPQRPHPSSILASVQNLLCSPRWP